MSLLRPNFGVPRDLFVGKKKDENIAKNAPSVITSAVLTDPYSTPKPVSEISSLDYLKHPHPRTLCIWYCQNTAMANSCKPLTIDRIEDLTLGAFGNLRPSETLNHLIRYLSTWSGSEYDIYIFLPDDRN